MNSMLPLFDQSSLMNLAIDATTKSALLLLAAALVTRALRKSPAAVRHWIWCLAFVGVLVVPALSILLPRWTIAVLSADTTLRSVEIAGDLPDTVRDTSATGRRHANDAIDSPAGRDPRNLHDVSMPADGQPQPGPAIAATAPVSSQKRNKENSSTTFALRWLAAVWVVGASLLLAPLMGGIAANWIAYWRSRRVVGDCRVDLLRELRSKLGLSRRVQLLETEAPIIPVTWGVLVPVILVPVESRTWNSDRQRFVLLHELAHIKRLDVLFQMIGRLGCALCWFNPLTWYGLHRLRVERELACDDWVVSTGERPGDYAAQLIALAESFPQLRRLPRPSFARPGVAIPMARPSGLEDRIVALLDRTRAHGRITRRLTALLAIAATILVIATAIVRPIAKAADETPPKAPSTEAKKEVAVLAQSLSIRGRVVDPDGKSVPKARVWIQRIFAGTLMAERFQKEEKTGFENDWNEWFSVAEADSKGEFRIEFDKGKLDEFPKHNPAKLQLAATGEGFGFGAWAFPAPGAGGEWPAVEIRLATDLNIEGRILTSDRKPAVDASVRVFFVRQPNEPALDQYIPEVRAGRTGFSDFDIRTVVLPPGQPKLGIASGSGIQANAITDEEGRFVLKGIGAERILRLGVRGPTIGSATIEVVTRPAPDDEPEAKSSGILYAPKAEDKRSVVAGRQFLGGGGGGIGGERLENQYYASFTHIGDPARTLRGVVRDRDTGQPISGIEVRGAGNSPSMTGTNGRFELTGCRKMGSLDENQYQIEAICTSGRYFNTALPVEDTPGTAPIEFNIFLAKAVTARGRVIERGIGKPAEGIVEYNPLYPNKYLDSLGIVRGSTLYSIPRSSVPIAADGTYELEVLPGPGMIVVRQKDYYTNRIPYTNDVYAAPRIDKQRLDEVLAGLDLGKVKNSEDQIYFDSGHGSFRQGRASFKATAIINPEETAKELTIDLSVARARNLQGVVLDPEGKPASGVMVNGLFAEHDYVGGIRDGNFTVHCLSPDEPRMLEFRQAKRKLAAKVEVPPDFQGTLTVRLKPADDPAAGKVEKAQAQESAPGKVEKAQGQEEKAGQEKKAKARG